MPDGTSSGLQVHGIRWLWFVLYEALQRAATMLETIKAGKPTISDADRDWIQTAGLQFIRAALAKATP